MEQKRSRGRPRIPAENKIAETVAIRLFNGQREKLDRLGGAKWVRERIRRAKDKAAA